MKNFKNYLRKIVLGIPLATIMAASTLPLQIRLQQSLILFTMLWFNVYILFEILGQ